MAFPQQFPGADPSSGSPPDFMDLIGGPNEEPNRKVILDSRAGHEETKLTSAEIQRRKINAASEYYRKLRENSLGPPPPLVPNNEVRTTATTTATATTSNR